jgi:hypothetical protein
VSRKLMLIAAVLTTVAGCDHTNPGGPSSLQTTDGLVQALSKQGLVVVDRGTEPRESFPFFSIQSRRINAAGEDVHVFEYPTAAAMMSDAAKVSPTGTPIGQTQITWIAPPRFYRKDQLLVLYVGSDARVIDALAVVLGRPFAGAT